MTKSEWENLFLKCGVAPGPLQKWAVVFEDFFLKNSFTSGFQNEAPDFLSQILHESGRLTTLEENLNYSAKRMTEVWPKRFPTLQDAQPYANNPKALANKTYGGRLGNTQPDDGWDFRGSGFIMVTGRTNFKLLGNVLGLPLEVQPELLRTPGEESLLAAFKWWEGNVSDAIMGNPVKVRKAVNGGDIGLTDTQKLSKLIGASL